MAIPESIQLSKFYNDLVKVLRSDTLYNVMEWMAFHSQSLILNYGEDNEMWECSWIINGVRFSAVRQHPLDALKDILGDVRTKIITDGRIN